MYTFIDTGVINEEAPYGKKKTVERAERSVSLLVDSLRWAAEPGPPAKIICMYAVRCQNLTWVRYIKCRDP